MVRGCLFLFLLLALFLLITTIIQHHDPGPYHFR